jgi:hypothetical protein
LFRIFAGVGSCSVELMGESKSEGKDSVCPSGKDEEAKVIGEAIPCPSPKGIALGLPQASKKEGNVTKRSGVIRRPSLLGGDAF